jgi:hypothetical protein
MLHIFHTHVASVCYNVSSALDVWCIQMFHVVSVLCFRGIFRESSGHGPGAVGRGTASRGLPDGVRGVPRVLWTGHAHPHPGSRVLLARREIRGLRGRRTRRACRQGEVHVRGRMSQTGKDCSDRVGVRRVSAGPFGTVLWNRIPSDVWASTILL